MKLPIYFFVACLCISFSFCKPQKEKGDDTTVEIRMADITPRIESPEHEAKCQQAVLFEGSRGAYDVLLFSYAYGPELLLWAMIMANKYEDAGACNDVFLCFVNLIEDNFSKCSLDHLDDETRSIAISYLKKALERGHYGEGRALAKFYFEGKYVPQDSMIGKRILELKDEWWARFGTDSASVKIPFVIE